MATVIGGQLQPIELDECLALLSTHHLGRLAVVVGDQPLVFPVNYAMAGRQVVFRTDPGMKLYAAAGRRVGFEIDSADSQYHDGWSVLVVGVACEEHDPGRLQTLAKLPLTPWVSGAKSHWMCIRSSAVTGRRITHVVADD